MGHGSFLAWSMTLSGHFLSTFLLLFSGLVRLLDDCLICFFWHLGVGPFPSASMALNTASDIVTTGALVLLTFLVFQISVFNEIY